MLSNQWTLNDALTRLWQTDPITETPIRYQNNKKNGSKLPSDSEHAVSYEIGLHPTLNKPAADYVFTKKTSLGDVRWWYELKGTWIGSQAAPAKDEFYVKLVPLMSGMDSYEYKVKVNNDYTFSKSVAFTGEMIGIYDVQLGLLSGFTTSQIRASKSPAFIFAKDMPANAAEQMDEQPTPDDIVDGIVNYTIAYEYDSLNRVVKVTTPDYVTTYTYDFLGNRTQKIVKSEGPDESL